MAELFRFLDVRSDNSEHAYSFIICSGEIRLLQLSSGAEKDAMIDLAIGALPCKQGRIEIIRGDRRCRNKTHSRLIKERIVNNGPVPQIWLPLSASRSGRIGWVAANGGLISNLKIWENVTLPLWYHTRREVAETECSIMYWLDLLGLEQYEFAGFMAAPANTIEPWQRKLAGLLRALLQRPLVLIVDAAVFEGVKASLASRWITALEAYAAQGYAVLAMADQATNLPWKKIE